MLKLTTTSYLHLFNTLNFNIFVHKSRSNAQGIQLVKLSKGMPRYPATIFCDVFMSYMALATSSTPKVLRRF